MSFFVCKDEPDCWIAQSRDQRGLFEAMGPMIVALVSKDLDPLKCNFTIVLPDQGPGDCLGMFGYIGFAKVDK